MSLADIIRRNQQQGKPKPQFSGKPRPQVKPWDAPPPWTGQDPPWVTRVTLEPVKSKAATPASPKKRKPRRGRNRPGWVDTMNTLHEGAMRLIAKWGKTDSPSVAKNEGKLYIEPDADKKRENKIRFRVTKSKKAKQRVARLQKRLEGSVQLPAVSSKPKPASQSTKPRPKFQH